MFKIMNSKYSAEEKCILLDVADAVIKHGLQHNEEMFIDIAKYPSNLQNKGASFVTLEIAGELRGCIGSLVAYRPLIADVAHNAFAAAFEDPRFAPLTFAEYIKISKCISILNPPELMCFNSEADLLCQLRPGVDGLILSDQGCKGTFLPSVWEFLPDPKDFLCHLKNKAGLPTDYWSETLRVERYTVEVVE